MYGLAMMTDAYTQTVMAISTDVDKLRNKIEELYEQDDLAYLGDNIVSELVEKSIGNSKDRIHLFYVRNLNTGDEILYAVINKTETV